MDSYRLSGFVVDEVRFGQTDKGPNRSRSILHPSPDRLPIEEKTSTITAETLRRSAAFLMAPILFECRGNELK
jgi:hypothetical protein